MTRIVLHVGQHKTGSTALQYALAANRDALLQAGTLYPRLSSWKFAHHALFPHFFGVEHCDPFILRRLGRDSASALMASGNAWRDLKAEVSRHQVESILLSSEAFFTAPAPGRMERLGDILRELATQIEVVCYLRHPAEFVLSSFSTQVQMDDRFLWPNAGVRREVVEAYEALRPDRIHVIKYDRKSLRQGDIVQDFSSRFLDIGLAQPGLAQVNTSYSAEAMVVMQRFVALNHASRDRAMPYRQQAFRRLLKIVDGLVGGFSKPKLLPAVKASIARGCTDLDWLRDSYGVSWNLPDEEGGTELAGLSYGDPISPLDICHVDDHRLRKIERLMSVFSRLTRPMGNFAGLRKRRQ